MRLLLAAPITRDGSVTRLRAADADPEVSGTHVAMPSIVVTGSRPVRIGCAMVEPGRYVVSVDEIGERIHLEGDARSYAITAFFRKAQGLGCIPRAHLRTTADPHRRMLVVRSTPLTEWVA